MPAGAVYLGHYTDRRPAAVGAETLVDLQEMTKVSPMCVTFGSTLSITLTRVT